MAQGLIDQADVTRRSGTSRNYTDLDMEQYSVDSYFVEET